MSFTTVIILLLFLTDLSDLAVRAKGLLVSSSSIEYCEKNSAGAQPCQKKIVALLSVQSGQTAGTEEVVFIRDAVDRTSENQNEQVSFAPIRVSVSKTRVQYRYPVFYERNYNAKPYEEVISTDLFAGCNDKPNPSAATCGMTMDTNGQPILYSQGFCCNCSFCELTGLCPSNSRGTFSCSVFGKSAAASCLRFSPIWYSGYTVSVGYVWYRVNINVSIGEGSNENQTSTVMLQLGPDVIIDTSEKLGASAQLVGDFAPTESPMELTGKMLFVPSTPADNERVTAGSREWMILDRRLVTDDGRDCNKVGVSYEAFANQGNRCTVERGSCLANQIEDYRDSDLQDEQKGKRGQYLVRFLGDFAFSNNATSPYIAYWVQSSLSTMITLTITADNIRYVVSVSPGKIIDAAVSKKTITASTRDGSVAVTVTNIGTIPSQYTIVIGNCTTNVFPISAQSVSLQPQEAIARNFNLFVQNTSATGSAQCGIALRDARGAVIDIRQIQFDVLSSASTNGAQGGSQPGNTGGATDDSANSSGCGSCAWYNLPCYARYQCVWQPLLFTVVVGAILIAVVSIVLRCCPCKCLRERDATDEEMVNEPQGFPRAMMQNATYGYPGICRGEPMHNG